jgi:hypothetical protein
MRWNLAADELAPHMPGVVDCGGDLRYMRVGSGMLWN